MPCSTIYHVYVIPRQHKDYRTYLQASDELFSTELNFYPQKRIFIHTNLFLTTKSYTLPPGGSLSCAYHSRTIESLELCIYKHHANYFPQNRIFIHRVQFLSTYHIILIHRWGIWFKFTNQTSVQTDNHRGRLKDLYPWNSGVEGVWSNHGISCFCVFLLNFIIFSSSKTWIFINKLWAL